MLCSQNDAILQLKLEVSESAAKLQAAAADRDNVILERDEYKTTTTQLTQQLDSLRDRNDRSTNDHQIAADQAAADRDAALKQLADKQKELERVQGLLAERMCAAVLRASIQFDLI